MDMPSTCQDIDTTAKRLADLEAAVDALEAGSCSVEGSYTTWTIQGIYDTGVNVDIGMMGHDFVGIRNDGRVIWHDDSAFTSYIISPTGGLLATLPDIQNPSALGVPSIRRHSLTDRYLLLVDELFTDLIVQEGLVETWRRVVDNDKGAYTLTASPLTPLGVVGISPSGEWIVAVIKEDTTLNGLIFIYRGS